MRNDQFVSPLTSVELEKVFFHLIKSLEHFNCSV